MVKRLSDEDIERIADALMEKERLDKWMSEPIKRMSICIDDIITRRLQWAIQDREKYKMISKIIEMNFKDKLSNIEKELK